MAVVSAEIAHWTNRFVFLFLNSRILYCDERHTRGNSLKLKSIRTHYNLRKYSFSIRTINIWNSLPELVVTANTIDCFQTRLDKFWNSQHVCNKTRPRYDYNVFIGTLNLAQRNSALKAWSLTTNKISPDCTIGRWLHSIKNACYFNAFLVNWA